MKKMNLSAFKHPFVKRMCIAKSLGLLFGVLCAFGISRDLGAGIFSIYNPIFWMILLNRMFIGIFIAFAGFVTIHPIFKCRIYSCVRGFILGAFVSVLLALTVFLIPEMMDGQKLKMFFGLVFVGGIQGLIIDYLATRFGGEGKDLIIKK